MRISVSHEGLKVRIIAVICTFLLFITSAYAAASEGLPTQTVDVGIYSSPPFVMKKSDGRYGGMAIELWEEIGKNLGFKTNYIRFDTVEKIIRAAERGEIDVIVTNLMVTYQRAEQLKFTFPWYDGGLRIMTKVDARISLLEQLRRDNQLQTYGGLLVLLLIVTFLLTLFRKHVDSDFPKRWGDGFARSFIDLVSLTKGGYVEQRYLGWVGHLLLGVWMLVGMALFAYITSTVTSAMTTVALTQEIDSLFDLQGKKVGVFTGSVSEGQISAIGLPTTSFRGIRDASAALDTGQIDALVADAPVLEYWAHTHPKNGLKVVGNLIHPNKYAFAANKRLSDFADLVSVELIKLHELEFIDNLKKKYFGYQEE